MAKVKTCECRYDDHAQDDPNCPYYEEYKRREAEEWVGKYLGSIILGVIALLGIPALVDKYGYLFQ